MQENFYNNIKNIISTERLEAYSKKDGATPCISFARYLWNMAVCESLYSPLQIAEVTLRNSVHQALSKHYGRNDWYNAFTLNPYGVIQLNNAKTIIRRQKKSFISADIVAELQFGFWISLFDKKYYNTAIPAAILKNAFALVPKHERTPQIQKAKWDKIRVLRNRVFHHERIIHWNDLATQHVNILNAIKLISPEMYELAMALDRFNKIHTDGIDPWKEKIQYHWPKEPTAENK